MMTEENNLKSFHLNQIHFVDVDVLLSNVIIVSRVVVVVAVTTPRVVLRGQIQHRHHHCHHHDQNKSKQKKTLLPPPQLLENVLGDYVLLNTAPTGIIRSMGMKPIICQALLKAKSIPEMATAGTLPEIAVGIFTKKMKRKKMMKKKNKTTARATATANLQESLKRTA